jgi:hypothetical protein
MRPALARLTQKKVNNGQHALAPELQSPVFAATPRLGFLCSPLLTTLLSLWPSACSTLRRAHKLWPSCSGPLRRTIQKRVPGDGSSGPARSANVLLYAKRRGRRRAPTDLKKPWVDGIRAISAPSASHSLAVWQGWEIHPRPRGSNRMNTGQFKARPAVDDQKVSHRGGQPK